MGISHTFLSLLIYCIIISRELVFSIDILDQEETYCNENNVSDLICVPNVNILGVINEKIAHLSSSLRMEEAYQDMETYMIFSHLEFVKNPLYSCSHPKSRLVELENIKKAFICVATEELQMVLQCKSGYELTEVLVENPSKLLGYGDSEIRPRTAREKKYAIKSDKLCIKTVKVPVEITCKDGNLKDGFCVEEVTTNPLYECPSGLHVTPRKWCGYIKRELNESLMENVIKRTNPGCVIKTVHPWFKSTARVECYNGSNGYVVGITEDDWVSVVPAAIRCPKDFDLVFPTYPMEKAAKRGDFTFPPLCLARKYLPRSISCPGVLLRKGMIVTDRYIVDAEINPTPFKQHIDVSHYSCQLQDRVKPKIVCPIIDMGDYFGTRSSLSSSEHSLSSHWSTMEAINYQSGLFDFTSYSNLLNRNPSILSELEETQRGLSGNASDNDSSLLEDLALNTSEADEDLSNSLEPVPFHKHNMYKMELHEYKHYYNDTIEKHLKSLNDYNNHEFSYYPFRLNTTLDNPWNDSSSSHLRREGHGKIHAGHPKEAREKHPAKDLKKIQPSRQGEYFNDYQWDFLSKFYRVYVSNQINFVSNIPVSSISHKAQTIDGGYQLNINLDPTYQSFVNSTLEQMKNLDSRLNITNIRDSLNETNNSSNIDVPQLIDKLSTVNDTIASGNEPNITRNHEYNAWERSARLYFMDLDLMKKNQILYSSVNSYKHKRKFPFLYYYGKQPSIHNDYGHVRRAAISDHMYRYGSPSEDYHKYTGRHESSNLLYYLNKYLNQTKPYRHPPGPETPYKCISINETTPIIECPGSNIIIPKCFILDIIHAKLTEHYRMTHNASIDSSNDETEPTTTPTPTPTPEETNDDLEKENEEELEEINELIDNKPISTQQGVSEMGNLGIIGDMQGPRDTLNELAYLGNIGGLQNIEMIDNIEGFRGIEV